MQSQGTLGIVGSASSRPPRPPRSHLWSLSHRTLHMLFLPLVLQLLLSPSCSGQLQQMTTDDAGGGELDDSLTQNDPNLINTQNKQGYGHDVPIQVLKTGPMKGKPNNSKYIPITEQTVQAVLQLGVLVAVSLLVGTLFFINMVLEMLFDKIMDSWSKHFSRAKTPDIEEQDPAALVGTFKRYK